jgi:hypothetical protein
MLIKILDHCLVVVKGKRGFTILAHSGQVRMCSKYNPVAFTSHRAPCLCGMQTYTMCQVLSARSRVGMFEKRSRENRRLQESRTKMAWLSVGENEKCWRELVQHGRGDNSEHACITPGCIPVVSVMQASTSFTSFHTVCTSDVGSSSATLG